MHFQLLSAKVSFTRLNLRSQPTNISALDFQRIGRLEETRRCTSTMPWGKQSSWQYEPYQWLKWDCQSVLPADILIAYMASIFRLEVHLLADQNFSFSQLAHVPICKRESKMLSKVDVWVWQIDMCHKEMPTCSRQDLKEPWWRHI